MSERIRTHQKRKEAPFLPLENLIVRKTMNPSLISDDLSDISLDALFQPPTSPYLPPIEGHLTNMPDTIRAPLSVDQGPMDNMEYFQYLDPSLVLSPGLQWRPSEEDQDYSVKTIKEPPDDIDEKFLDDPISSSLWMSRWDGFGGLGILTDADFSRTQSGGTVPVQLDDEMGKVICESSEAKVKFKEKVIAGRTQAKKKSGVAKVGNRIGGGGRRAAAASAMSSSSGAGPEASSSIAADEERRRRRQESNRRAAERYRTKQKASAVDFATERHRLMDANDRLSQENCRLRRLMSTIISSIQHHQQFCSVPIPLSEQFHLETFHASDISTSSQVGSTSQAEPFQSQFQIGGSEPIPFLVAEPFGGGQLEERQAGSLGQLRVIGLYTNSSPP